MGPTQSCKANYVTVTGGYTAHDNLLEAAKKMIAIYEPISAIEPS